MAQDDLGKYLYVSQRIANAIVNAHEADSSPRRFEVDAISVKPTGIGVDVRRPTEQSSVEALASKATRILESQKRIGTLVDTSKQYVRLRVDAHLSEYLVKTRWKERSHGKVAGIVASQVIDGIGRVYVVLIGSVSNFLRSTASEPIGLVDGWNPSHIEGLYGLFDQVREDGDPVPHRSDVEDPVNLDARQMLRRASWIASGNLNIPYPLRRVEILAEAHHVFAGPVAVEDGTVYDIAVVGAPVWVREVTSDRDPTKVALPKMDLLSHTDDREHSFDELRRDVLAAQRLTRTMYGAMDLHEARAFNLAKAKQRDQVPDRPSEQREGERTVEKNAGLAAEGAGSASSEALSDRQQRAADAESAAQALKLRAMVAVTSPEKFADLVRWFFHQAQYVGIQENRLVAYRRPVWWQRWPDRQWVWRSDPKPTNVSGYIVPLPWSKHAMMGVRIREYVLVTLEGEIYSCHYRPRRGPYHDLLPEPRPLPLGAEEGLEAGRAIEIGGDAIYLRPASSTQSTSASFLAPSEALHTVPDRGREAAREMFLLATRWRETPYRRASAPDLVT